MIGRAGRRARRSCFADLKTRCAVVCLSLSAAFLFAGSAHAATASWSLTPPSYDFGAVEPGTESAAPAVFTLTNTGQVDLLPPQVLLQYEQFEIREPEIFEISQSDCQSRSNLAAGESCTVNVVFKPQYPGPRSGSITFTDPGAKVAPLTATYSGVGLGPIVSISPPSVWAWSLLLGDGPSIAKVLTLTNSGDLDLAISAIALENAVLANAAQFAVVGGSCRVGGALAPGAGCTIQLTFSPTVAGPIVAQLRIADNAAHGFQLVPIEGIGAVPPAAKPAPLATFISQRPRKVSTRRFARFRFGVAGGHVQFACKLDRRPFHPCASPTTYRHLSFGDHVFRVKTLSRTPGVSPTPAMARFQVIPGRAG